MQIVMLNCAIAHSLHYTTRLQRTVLIMFDLYTRTIHSHSHSFYCIRKSMQYNNTNRRNTDTIGTSKSSQGLSKPVPKFNC